MDKIGMFMLNMMVPPPPYSPSLFSPQKSMFDSFRGYNFGMHPNHYFEMDSVNCKFIMSLTIFFVPNSYMVFYIEKITDKFEPIIEDFSLNAVDQIRQLTGLHHEHSCPLHSKNVKVLEKNVKCTCGKFESGISKEVEHKLTAASMTTNSPVTFTV